MNNLKISFIRSISEIAKDHYQQLINTDYPFIQYDFLRALETSEAVGKLSGWQSCHLLIKHQLKPIAFVPIYLKTHSYGEYVFDFEWAKAYHSNAVNYYPKLVTAIPFTPVTGIRICHHKDFNLEQLVPTITAEIKKYVKFAQASSWHLLFPPSDLGEQLCKQGLLQRNGVQFHWFNKGYANFDEFLNKMNSKRRKDIRRERKKVAAQGIKLSTIEGKDISQEMWHSFHQFYQLTYAKRSGHGGYLKASFFKTIGNSMPENIVLVAAFDNELMIAAALFLKDKQTLYGRYWGCTREYDFLHFEACYYQGIDYCIKHQLQKFDAGAQGEHKIQRGFEAVITSSNHWIDDENFREAIEHFVQQEKRYNENYVIAAKARSPFK